MVVVKVTIPLLVSIQGDCINVRIISYSKLCNGYDTNDTGNSVKCVSDRKMYRYAST